MNPLLYAVGCFLVGCGLGLAGDRNFSTWMAACVVIVALTPKGK